MTTNIQTSGFDLSSRAMLVLLSIRAWGGQRLDKDETDRVTKENGASKDALRVTKDLVGDALDDLRKSERQIREVHRNYTLPWADDTTRLLPTKTWEKYQEELTPLIDRHREVTIPKFIERYQTEVIPGARKRLGSLFRASDFPSDISGKFSVSVRYLPVPDTNDVRVRLSKEEVAALKEEVEEATRDAYTLATRDLVERATKPLARLSEALREYGPGKRLSKALLTNVADIAELLPELSVTHEPFFQEIADDIRELVANQTTERLTANTRNRQRIASDADRLTAKLAGLI